MNDSQEDLVAFLNKVDQQEFAIEAAVLGDFGCQALSDEACELAATDTLRILCMGTGEKKSLFLSDNRVWSDMEVSSFFGSIASDLNVSALAIVVLRPNKLGIDASRRSLRESIEILRDPRNPFPFAQVDKSTGNLVPLENSRIEKRHIGSDARVAFENGDMRIAGFLLGESARSVEDLQAWLLGIVESCARWLEVDEITNLVDIVADRSRWSEAKQMFSNIRGLTIGEDPQITRDSEVSICLLAEDVAKVAYSLTWPTDPFDRRARHAIGPGFAKIAQTMGMDGWEGLLFSDGGDPIGAS